ncbi:MAG: AtpZ/AtpI family protein [Gammaproteobacteria bacterium]
MAEQRHHGDTRDTATAPRPAATPDVAAGTAAERAPTSGEAQDGVRADTLAHAVGRRERRKLWARRNALHSVWFGFGLFGMVGWSVVTPTVGGALAGWLLDRRFPGGRSWTLTLLIAGLAVGCAIAWHWIARELDTIRRTGDAADDE